MRATQFGMMMRPTSKDTQTHRIGHRQAQSAATPAARTGTSSAANQIIL